MKFFAFASLLTLFTISVFSQQGKLYLTIIDRETNLTIPNVKITIVKESTRNFSIVSDNGLVETDLSYGNYTIITENENYLFEKLNISIDNKQQYYKIVSQNPVQIPDVQITSLGISKKISDIMVPLTVLKNNEILSCSSLTAADALSQVPGVYVAKDGTWASAINLRGLSEQRIVTLIDGFRVETAAELAGGFGMVDLNNVSRIEVVKASASDKQGTGAVGGLINYVTREGYYADKLYTGGNFSQQYQTANNLRGTHLNLNFGDKKWWIAVSGSFRDANNLRTPDGVLANSSFSDKAVNFKVGIKITEYQEFKLIFQKFEADNVGIPGGSFSQTSVATYKNANRDLLGFEYTIRNSNVNSIWKKATVNGFYQFIQRDVDVVSPAVKLEPTGKHTTLGIKGMSEWQIADLCNIEAGAELWQREMTSQRRKIVNAKNKQGADSITILGELPLPHAWYTSTGSYLSASYKPLPFIQLTLSTRADAIHISNDQAITPQYQIVNGVNIYPPAKQRIIFDAGNNDNYSLSYQGGVGISINSQNKFNLMIAKSFRSPSLEERFKYIDLGSTVNYGNPALKPEDGWFYNVGYTYKSQYVDLKVDGFINSIHNYITSVPGKFSYTTPSNSKDTIKINANVTENLNHAILTGGEFSTTIFTQSPISFSANVSYVRGLEKRTNTNLPLMPPLNGQIAIHYLIKNWCTLTAQTKLADEQPKIADKELITGGYALYNFYIESAEYNLYWFKLKGFTGIENITDRAWRNHLATNRGLIRLESGRNVFIKLQLNW